MERTCGNCYHYERDEAKWCSENGGEWESYEGCARFRQRARREGMTVQEFIEELQEVDDKTKPICFWCVDNEGNIDTCINTAHLYVEGRDEVTIKVED